MKNLKIALSVVTAVCVSSLALADNPAATAAKPAEKAATAATAAAATTMAKSATVNGKVGTVNAEGKFFTVNETMKGADGKETSKETKVWWSETTKLAWHNEGKTAATQSDLKAGAEVMIKAEANKDGNWVATEIWIHPTMMGKTMEKAATDKATEKAPEQK